MGHLLLPRRVNLGGQLRVHLCLPRSHEQGMRGEVPLRVKIGEGGFQAVLARCLRGNAHNILPM
jgi:hypothetical protein